MFRNFNYDNYLYVTLTNERLNEKDQLSEEYDERFNELKEQYFNDYPDLSGVKISQMVTKALEAEFGSDPYDERFVDEEELAQTPYFDEICKIYSTDVDMDTLTVRAMSRAFADDLNINMHYGSWFSPTDDNDNIIDVVILKNTEYSVGDTFSLTFFQYNEVLDSLENIDTGFTARVIGICEYSQSSPLFGVTSSSFDSLTFQDFTLDYGEVNICVAIDEDIAALLKKYDLNQGINASSSEAIIKLDSDADVEQAKSYLSKLRYSSESMTRFYSNTLDKGLENLSSALVPTVVAVCFCILAITAIFVFQLQTSANKFRMYFYCGMERGKDKYIHFIYLSIMTVCAILLALAAYFAICFYEYVQRIYSLCEAGYSYEQVQSWISINDYIQLPVLSIVILVVLSALIFLASTIACSFVKSKD